MRGTASTTATASVMAWASTSTSSVFGRKSNIVEEGAVITVEPGIYLPAWAACAWRTTAWSPEDGYEPFTTSTR